VESKEKDTRKARDVLSRSDFQNVYWNLESILRQLRAELDEVKRLWHMEDIPKKLPKDRRGQYY
jgi:hypothetical protein